MYGVQVDIGITLSCSTVHLYFHAAPCATNDQTYTDFMARRMVEMAGDIVMSYLLLDDANRNDSFTASLHVYVNMAESEVCKHADFIAKVTPAEMDFYKKA